MIIAFMTAYFGGRHERAAAFLFTTAIQLFTMSLIAFVRELKAALNQNDLA
jgi:hypothetical protein